MWLFNKVFKKVTQIIKNREYEVYFMILNESLKNIEIAWPFKKNLEMEMKIIQIVKYSFIF